MIIGLTGGIASGKSTVSSLFHRHGASIVDADRIAREVVEPGRPALQAVVEAFGQRTLNEDGTLNRKRLGEIVFQDADKRKQLESILHPEIRRIMRERLNKLERDNPRGLHIADIPLLFESGLQSMVEEVVLVYVPPEVQIERLIARDNLSREQAEQRLAAQFPIERKKAMADYMIDNSGSVEQTEQQVITYIRRKEKA